MQTHVQYMHTNICVSYINIHVLYRERYMFIYKIYKVIYI